MNARVTGLSATKRIPQNMCMCCDTGTEEIRGTYITHEEMKKELPTVIRRVSGFLNLPKQNDDVERLTD